MLFSVGDSHPRTNHGLGIYLTYPCLMQHPRERLWRDFEA